jgi:hypothetical protein
MHIAEVFAMVVSLGFCCLCGTMPWQFFLPVALAAFIPFGRMCALHPSLACLKRVLVRIGLVLASPVLLLAAVGYMVLKYPRRVVNPFRGGPHIVVAVSAIPLCLIPASNVYAAMLWTVHSTMLLAGLVERLFVKRLQWHEGGLWWIALQLSVLAAYVANTFCEFPAGIKIEGSREVTVAIVSCGWLVMVTALVTAVNWSLCVRFYHTWQSRNGTFTLHVPALAEARQENSVAGQQASRGSPSATPV